MIAQLEIEFEEQTQADRAAVTALIALLEEQRGWLSAAELLNLLGQAVTENNRRWLRRVKEDAEGWIISGQKGYRHIRHASPEEIHHAAAWLESQASDMAGSAAAIRRRAHEVIHQAKAEMLKS